MRQLVVFACVCSAVFGMTLWRKKKDQDAKRRNSYHRMSNQVGGHRFEDGKRGMLCMNGVVLKPMTGPRGLHEVEFFRQVFASSDPVDETLRPFLPKFHGTDTVKEGDGEILYVKLQDLTFGLSRPCVMDVKMGAKSYEPDASDKKKSSEIAKFPLQAEIGFRYVGMKVYQIVSDSYVEYDKYYGRSLTSDNIIDGFRNFLTNGTGALRLDVIPPLLSRLKALLGWFETVNDRYVFIASSLLIVYEGDGERVLRNEADDKIKNEGGEGSGGNDINSARLDVRLIDFAHVRRDGHRDDDFIVGLRSVVALLQQLQQPPSY